MLLALAVKDIGELEVSVSEGAAYLVGSVRHLARSGKDALLGGRKNMLRPAANAVKAAAIGLKLGLCHIEKVQRILVNRHNLGRGKGGSLGNLNEAAHCLAAHILIKAV